MLTKSTTRLALKIKYETCILSGDNRLRMCVRKVR